MVKPKTSILIADDDPLIGPVLRDILAYLGYSICALATSEDAAVADALSYRPDLIVMDAGLQPGNGIDAIERIVALIGPVPHIFISGALDGIRVRAPGTIALQKPFGIEQIDVAIQHALGHADAVA